LVSYRQQAPQIALVTYNNNCRIYKCRLLWWCCLFICFNI